MKKTIVIKKNYEFRTLFNKGKFYHGDFVLIYITKNNCDYNKIGIAVSKKQGKAVKRNRFKRLVRENYKVLENKIDVGYNILFVGNKSKSVDEMDFYSINNNLISCFKKAGIYNE